MEQLILGPWDCEETRESLEDFESLLASYRARVKLEDGRPFEVYSGEKITVSVEREYLKEVKQILREKGFDSKNCKLYVIEKKPRHK